MTSVLPNVHKIAVLRANALGDFIFTLPALRALREAYPDAELILIGRKWHEAFLGKRTSVVDRVIVVPEGFDLLTGRKENREVFNRFLHNLRKENLDIAIQVYGGGKYSNPFITSLEAKVTVGLKTPDAIDLDYSVPYIYYQNEILRYLEVVSCIGATTPYLEPVLPVVPEDKREVEDLLSTVKPIAVLHPGASDLRRRWDPQRFAAVGKKLLEKGFVVYITGTEPEREICDEVDAALLHQAKNICGTVSLSGLTGLLSEAKVLIANDTGPLHLAEAVGCPTVGIYWCGNYINAGPLSVAIHRGCISWTTHCPLCGKDMTAIESSTSFVCKHDVSFVDSITVDEVRDQVDAVLTTARNEQPITPSLYLSR